MSAMEVHRVRFLQHNPSAIQCLAFQDGSSPARLALSRENGNVEIWQNDQAWAQTMVLHASKEECAESILWYGDRLLSAGLSGALVEWSLARQCPESQVNLSGGAVWDMAIRPHHEEMAVACEDGCVRMFVIEPDTVVYKKAYSNQGGGRCLSVAFHPEGNHMISGGSDSIIRVWNLITGVAVQRITLDQPRQQAVLIWTLAFLQDMTIVSGDSSGVVQFWSGLHGNMIQSFSLHKADILSIVTNKKQDTVYAAGVDSKVHKLHCLDTEGAKKWINAGSVRLHSHDVRSLALRDEEGSGALASGGLDTQLCVYATNNFSIKNSRLFSSYPRTSPVSICREEPLVACQFDSHVDMWSLGTARGGTDLDSAADGTVLATLKQPAHLLRIKAKGRHHIACSAVSPCGKWMAISDRSGTRVFAVASKKPSGSDSKQSMSVSSASQSLDTAQRLAFTPDSSRLLLASNYGLQVATVECGDVSECRDVYQTARSSCACVGLKVSTSGRYAAIAFADNHIDVIDLKKEKVKLSSPRLPSQCSAMMFPSSSSSSLLIYTLAYQVYLFNFTDGSLDDLSPHLRTISTARRSLGPVMDCMELNDKRVMFYSNAFMATLDLDKAPEKAVDTKVRPRKRKSTADLPEAACEAMDTEEKAGSPAKSLSISTHFADILAIGCCGQSRLAVVERPWKEVTQTFPDALHRVRYGAA
ncbi:U3 small nucleolar RNA-associated protein 4 homolog [Sycon ciliatum]|uniref:U3 small nucleolar RNA-associated protein 4 homolog n=1 Tax=Sycon ciliatum TaxID=27933 RepID=UPI0031F62A70